MQMPQHERPDTGRRVAAVEPLREKILRAFCFHNKPIHTILQDFFGRGLFLLSDSPWCSKPRDLIDFAGILIHERVEVYDVTNGSRFATYAIEGERGSGTICINGAAAHLCRPGDLVIICAYVGLTPGEAEKHTPMVLLLDEKNRIKKRKGVLIWAPSSDFIDRLSQRSC